MSEDARLNTAAAAAPQADLTGIGVVAGVAARPAMWVRPRPALPTDGPEIPESDRESQKERFDIAAATVAGRLDARAQRAEGHAAEVLGATAALVTDKGWRRAVGKQIDSGASAELAAARATDTFVAKFEKIGGLMAERTTDLKAVSYTHLTLPTKA